MLKHFMNNGTFSPHINLNYRCKNEGTREVRSLACTRGLDAGTGY